MSDDIECMFTCLSSSLTGNDVAETLLPSGAANEEPAISLRLHFDRPATPVTANEVFIRCGKAAPEGECYPVRAPTSRK